MMNPNIKSPLCIAIYRYSGSPELHTTYAIISVFLTNICTLETNYALLSIALPIGLPNRLPIALSITLSIAVPIGDQPLEPSRHRVHQWLDISKNMIT